MNGSFSTWRETIVGVPQGSVLGPLLFKKYLNDIIMFLNDTQICNYADDATIHAWDNNREIAEWFLNNCMKLNEDKCHLMVFGDKGNDVSLNIGGVNIKESNEEKWLGVILDKKTML